MNATITIETDASRDQVSSILRAAYGDRWDGVINQQGRLGLETAVPAERLGNADVVAELRSRGARVYTTHSR